MKRVLSKRCYVSHYDGIKVTWTSPIIKNKALGLKAFLYVWLDIFCFWDRFCTQTQMKALYLFWGRLFHITWRELSQSCHSLGLCKSWEALLGMVDTMILAFDKWGFWQEGSVLSICGCGSSTELNEWELVALLLQRLLTLPSDGRFLTLAQLSRPALHGES